MIFIYLFFYLDWRFLNIFDNLIKFRIVDNVLIIINSRYIVLIIFVKLMFLKYRSVYILYMYLLVILLLCFMIILRISIVNVDNFK